MPTSLKQPRDGRQAVFESYVATYAELERQTRETIAASRAIRLRSKIQREELALARRRRESPGTR